MGSLAGWVRNRLRAARARTYYRLANELKSQNKLLQAVARYHAALRMNPDFAEAQNNLGVTFHLLNRTAEALACYRRAIELNPKLNQPYLNAGHLLEAQNRKAEAAAYYRQAIAAGVQPGAFQHLLNALEGMRTERAPDDYVRTFFDGFADDFDATLAGLDYRIPEILARAVNQAGKSNTPLDVLDIGCGTGQCGRYLHDGGGRMVGVDLSRNMLQKARALGIYSELVECEISAYLDSAPATSFDVIVSADVFIYIGELAAIFRNCARILRSGGVMAFSIEAIEETGKDFELTQTGRYAQSPAYVRMLAQQSGLMEASFEPTAIRKEKDGAVRGYVAVLRKP